MSKIGILKNYGGARSCHGGAGRIIQRSQCDSKEEEAK